LARFLAQQLAGMDPWRHLGYSQESLEGFFLRPACDAERYLIRVADDIAGVLCLKQPWLRGVYLEQLALLPSYQRRGLGRRALEFIEQSHPQAANIWLLVSRFNQPARHFYLAHGFAELCCIEDLLLAGEDEVLMRKRLPPRQN
jgi:ribosomal protein S18 acetylase RimI-like enzyme